MLRNQKFYEKKNIKQFLENIVEDTCCRVFAQISTFLDKKIVEIEFNLI